METTSGVLDGLLALPSGGGAARGIGERFQPDLLRGSGSYAIPLPQPKGPNELAPSLSLRYSTGQGNGPFGVGWQLGGPIQIGRRTDRGVPRYDEEDELTIAGADVLVPVGGGRYRPAADRQGWRIERDGEGWSVTTKEGRGYSLGSGPESRIADGGRVFAWLVDRETDPAGNAISYRWDHDQGAAYLAEVTWSIYALRLSYEPRPDPLRDGRAGFGRRTRLRCTAIERFADRLAQPLLAGHRLSYAQAEGSEASLLSEVRLTGHGADGSTEDAPPIRLGYSQLRPADATLRRIGGDDVALPPLGERGTTLVDMDGDGLADVLETGERGHRWWRNRGDGGFDPPRRLPGEPPGMVVGSRGVTFADLDGDGTADLLRAERRLTTTVPNTGAGEWGEPVVTRSQPVVEVSGDRTRMVDLDGDGVTDLLQLGRRGAIATYNEPGKGWSAPEARLASGDGGPPPVDLDAPEVHLADMTGDGLTDVVAVSSGRVEYWPSEGRTSWGAPVSMADPPLLPRRYDPARVHLVDLDGDGVSDLVYIDAERVLTWINKGGAGWSAPYEVPYVPRPDADGVQFVDLLGSGTRGLVWDSLRGRRRGGYDYLDLSGATKPNLLTRIDHGDGGVSGISYATSTALRRADERRGEPWETFLPFPLHVVERIAERDALTGRERVTSMRYHGGVWSGTEREFRGFGRVEVTRSGDESTPGVVEESTFAVRGERALAGSPTAVRVFEQADDGARTLLRSSTIEWAARVEHDGPGGSVRFPHVSSAEVRDHAPGAPDRIETAVYDYDEFGNLVRKQRAARFSDQPESEALRTDERLTYAREESRWRVGLPASIELRDADGRLCKATQHLYDGPAFEGLPLGQVGDGLLRRTRELVLADWALPAGYADAIDPGWGLVHEDEGWWRTAVAYAHDEHGNVSGRRDGLGAERRIEYDADALFPRRHTDVDGGVTTASFDERAAAPTEVVLADGCRTRYEYSPLGWLAAKRDTAGDGSLELTEAQRVEHGDLAASPPRPPRLVRWRVFEPGLDPDELPAPEAAQQPAGAAVSCDYFDGFGNLVERVSRAPAGPGGAPRWVVSRQRDHTVDGRAAADYPDVFADGPGYRPPSGEPVRFAYDPLGAVRGIVQPDGARLRMHRAPGRLERWDGSMADDAPPVVERYDALGRLVGIEEHDGTGGTLPTAYDVDPLGRVTAIHDAAGRVATRYTFAGPGPCVRLEHADAGERTYFRDAEGRIRLRTDALGRRLEMEYDDNGRLVRGVDTTDPGQAVVVRELAFDGARLTSAREGELTTRFEYDAAGRQTARTIEFGPGEELTLRREYGLQGELRALVDPDGARVDYAYDDSGALSGAPGWVEGVEYDAGGSPLRLDLPGGAAARYTHDPVTRRLTGAALDGPDGTLRQVGFEHDRGGRIVAQEDELSAGASYRREFAYDGLSRIAAAETSGAATRHDRYAYSPTGDLLRNDESPATAAMEYGDAAHAGRLTRLRSAQGDTVDLAYDDGGRIVALGSALALEYDVWDRLVRAELEDGTVVRFSYDVEGTRIRKRVEAPGGEMRETRYVEDLYTAGPEGSSVSVRFGRLLVGQRTVAADGEERSLSFLVDHLGSVLAACDHVGGFAGEQLYAPFGRPLAGGDDARYVGARGDPELGLVQFGARYYAPALGRFVTPDWFAIENPSRLLRLPQAQNAYGYAINNPLVLRDPAGLWFGIDDAIVAAVGFVVGFVVGVVVGIAQGRSFGDTLLLGLEAGLLGAAGAWLAWNTAGAALGLLGIAHGAGTVGFGIMVGAAVVGGLNGVIGGATEIYDWSSPEGWLAFVLDSTWGLVGTTLGLLVMGVNLFYGSDAKYRPDLSKRQNRHVYDGGFGFGHFAFTQGNVTSNLRGRGTSSLSDHETLHIWQSRAFGPVFQVTYVAWMIVGAVVGFGIGLFTAQPLGKDITDVAYVDNPWETWAYAVGGHADGGELAWI